MINENMMIIGQDQYFDLDCIKTQLNNHVLVVGASGAGKTRSIVTPNILQAYGSYVIVDPKGNLYDKHSAYLRQRGYVVRKLNFAYPGDPESCSYNFFEYIRSEQDVIKIAHMMIYCDDSKGRSLDPFWNEAAELLLVSLIGYLYRFAEKRDRNLETILKLMELCQVEEENSDVMNPLDILFNDIEDKNDFFYRSYQRFRLAAGKTLKSILITLSAKLSVFDTKELKSLFAEDTTIISEIGLKKTALFVVVSDTDRCMDSMANLFFTQSINELCRVADGLPNQKLPFDVRFILDDFATNVCIGDFPRMIASIRSRGISTMLIIQAESQLTKAYGADGSTIIGNCDTYVYLGGNDVETAENVARRANLPLYDVLYMPIGKNIIFRRGQVPIESGKFILDDFLEAKRKEVIPESVISKASRKRNISLDGWTEAV